MRLAFIVIGILLGVAGCSSPGTEPDGGGTGGTGGNAGRVGGTGGASGSGAGGVSGGGAGGVSGGGAAGLSGKAGTDGGGTSGVSSGFAGGGAAGAAGAAGTGGLPAPSGQLITDFSGGPSLVGPPYSGAGQGWATPVADTSSGALHVTLSSGASTGMYSYAYVGLPLTNAPFKASSNATGVTFTISGALAGPGCELQFSTIDQDHASMAMNGHCIAVDGCYPSGKVFALPAPPTRVTVRWSDQVGGVGFQAAPSSVNPTQIVGVQWQIETSSGALGSSCVADLFIDDISITD